MSRESKDFIWSIIVLICGIWIGFVIATERIRNDAIKEGKGEYYFDENHNKQWRWKE